MVISAEHIWFIIYFVHERVTKTFYKHIINTVSMQHLCWCNKRTQNAVIQIHYCCVCSCALSVHALSAVNVFTCLLTLSYVFVLCTLWVWRNSHLEGMTWRKSSDTIGYLWSDLPACSLIGQGPVVAIRNVWRCCWDGVTTLYCQWCAKGPATGSRAVCPAGSFRASPYVVPDPHPQVLTWPAHWVHKPRHKEQPNSFTSIRNVWSTEAETMQWALKAVRFRGEMWNSTKQDLGQWTKYIKPEQRRLYQTIA